MNSKSIVPPLVVDRAATARTMRRSIADCASSCGPSLLGDGRRLGQLLANLVGNVEPGPGGHAVRTNATWQPTAPRTAAVRGASHVEPSGAWAARSEDGVEAPRRA